MTRSVHYVVLFVLKGADGMKAHDAVKFLGIKISTLRKYALLFEANGYLYARDAQNNRIYSQQDVMILRSFIDLRAQMNRNHRH